jgi:transcriptional regulator with XRE-family HTH domain
MSSRIGNAARRRRHFIREWRLFRGLTQEELAESLDTTKASISRIENFQQQYTQDFLEACADVLGTHPGVLLTRVPGASDREAAPTKASRLA